MKKIIISLTILFIAVIFFNNCEKEDKTPPELPPYESMAIDFSKMTKSTKSAGEFNLSDTTQWNYGLSALTVGYWNIVLGVTLAVPVASFYKSFQNEPDYLGDKKWQWGYTVTVLAANYNARLTGTIRQNDVKWEMYISKSGVGAFDEFLWFEGTSDLDGMGGQWILYESPLHNEAMLRIDWSKTGDAIGSIKYTYVRESDNGIADQLSNDSYLSYGLVTADYDAYYTVHYNTRNLETEPFKDVFIEWNTTQFNGRIKAQHYFQNADWHCWDNQGYDTVCP